MSGTGQTTDQLAKENPVPAWSAPQRPATYAEDALIAAILEGVYEPDSALPAERQLAAQLGVTRPTLREVLQRLERDGWLTIHQGKPTVVNDCWRQGGLNVLSSILRHKPEVAEELIPKLLEVRAVLAPAYVRAAVGDASAEFVKLLEAAKDLTDTPEAFATFDSALHRALTLASGNPVYTMILNGFGDLYEEMACRYFQKPEARIRSRTFYAALLTAARAQDPDAAEQITAEAMGRSVIARSQPEMPSPTRERRGWLPNWLSSLMHRHKRNQEG